MKINLVELYKKTFYSTKFYPCTEEVLEEYFDKKECSMILFGYSLVRVLPVGDRTIDFETDKKFIKDIYDLSKDIKSNFTIDEFENFIKETIKNVDKYHCKYLNENQLRYKILLLEDEYNMGNTSKKEYLRKREELLEKNKQ